MLALPTQKIEVATASPIGIFVAHFRAIFIHGALPLGRMKEAASAFVHGIFAMLEHAPVAFDQLRKFLFGIFRRQIKALSQAFHIAFRDDDVIIRTAIAGAFRAIVERFQDREFFGHDKF